MGLIDTNVLVVANGRGDYCPSCVDACVDCVENFTKNNQRLFLDAGGEILAEYGRNLHKGTPRGVGDAFYVWAMTYQATPSVCRKIRITPDDEWEYTEFPNVEELRGFDRSDRKFVAVAIASGESPTIYNAVDSDWGEHIESLSAFVSIKELCL